ncbi:MULTISPECIES: PqiA/YebS family transporter subunit [Rheinheimera]|uniref:PqiA/YebS family transporter subunit n=1 Tax=Rheinheimera marina TaxID=1774958 RepID=A0ABV9JNF2_9GAMM
MTDSLALTSLHKDTSHQPADELVLCRHCDLLQQLPQLQVGQEAACSRCGYLLDMRQKDPVLRPILYAFSALLMLVLSNLFPFIGMNVAGNSHYMDFIDTSSVLFEEHHQWLAVLVWLFIQAVPALCMLAVIYLKLGMIWPLRGLVWTARVLYVLKPWSMVDIFLIGVLVAFVKLVVYADIALGMSFWAFCLFCLLHLRTFQVIDRHALWQSIAPAPQPAAMAMAGRNGISLNLASCSCCTAIVAVEQKFCGRCGTKVVLREPYSLQKTLAWLITATVLYIPANFLPIMETVSLGSSIQSTIVSGIILMWRDGAYPVAIIILLASVVIPVLKIAIMFWLCYLAALPGHKRQLLSTRVYLVVDWIGRWSMVDVLVVAILAALVRFDLLMGVYPGMGALVFASVVITTMLAAMSFDPRLLWDQRQQKSAEGEGG